ncbi:MAG: hypothetical protein QF752_01690 [Planctomycetota bacterium]|nr:hypothetical protein [Planctomycetota bacterium]
MGDFAAPQRLLSILYSGVGDVGMMRKKSLQPLQVYEPTRSTICGGIERVGARRSRRNDFGDPKPAFERLNFAPLDIRLPEV